MRLLVTTASAAGFVVKATYNSTSGVAKLFVDSALVAQGAARPGATLASVAPDGAMFIGSSDGHSKHFQGALEELYIKDVSVSTTRGDPDGLISADASDRLHVPQTEHQPAYIFSQAHRQPARTLKSRDIM